MAESGTIARPYAKAAFEFALENKALARWSTALDQLAVIAGDEDVIAFVKNPKVTSDQRLALFESLFKAIAGETEDKKIVNFIQLLAINNRLLALPAIAEQFTVLKADHEKTVEVELTSAIELSDELKGKFASKLAKKLGRKVSIQNNVDPSLIGGLIVKAEDLVIDGSISGRIAKLSESLTF
ncbi:MAG TPA: F0F1 ATP synthase subunit delta [Aeromonadales bacterium]|nr:F0F1 ATP synthase subunit delta [Aeromonadales bacterium]